jgi:hypothetical protein
LWSYTDEIMTERNFGWHRVRLILLIAVGLSVLPILDAAATHLRAGQIQVRRLSPGSRSCQIRVTVYTDTDCANGCVLFGGELDVLDFGDGSSMLIPETDSEPLVPSVPGVGVASFTVVHTFPGNGSYIISYIEPNRNGGVLNMDNSINTTFYIETKIDLSVNGQSRSPELDIPPIDVGCVGVAFFHNPGAHDDDGDSLSYEMVIPFSDRGIEVVNYRDPNHPFFYTGDYNTANETADGPPTFSIDPIDGTLKWDSPGKVGEYNIAFIVREWRKSEGEWQAIGFVRRDMQIIIQDCNNERPKLIVPNDICVTAGTIINETIFGLDDTPNPTSPDHHPVKIEAFSEILDSSFPSRATVQPTGFQSSNPPAELNFIWNTTCDHVKDQAYLVVFKITDDPPLGPSLVTFETWRIKIVAPAPELISANTILPQRHAKLDWEPYECFEDASTMQVWRRVSDTNFTPDSCQTGMPESLGFTLIASLPIKNSSGIPITTYTDTNNGAGLEASAQYCYRLVAIYPLPKGGESYVSVEKCITPIETSEPVITKVSVEKTGEEDGNIRIEWMPPLDATSFPPPYEYQVQRDSNGVFINVSSRDAATGFTDAFLNTYDDQYFYRVLLFSTSISTTIPVDTSSIASSVWLELNPQKKKIQLTWNAVVPWSNQIQDHKMHLIYRGMEGAEESDMVLIDSVDVLQEGLIYLDSGKLAPGDTLNSTLEYCYRVKTRGGYGNPDIAEPLENFSQINCAIPTDDVPPCAPTIADFAPCKDFKDNYSCDAFSFITPIRWSVPDVCKDDVRSYNVYIKDGSGYRKIANVQDTFYLYPTELSIAYCYRVTAVDRSQNESEMSELVCNDNCPNYELPNVFSPNGDDCNDLFRAFGDELEVSENASCVPSDAEGDKCARFVLKVDFTVYNRWGKKVYSYVGQQGDDNRTIYIRWDGRDEKGRELAAGVYFYVAEVTYDVINPKDRVKIVKGWVHLIR